jgi:hypothetical protein
MATGPLSFLRGCRASLQALRCVRVFFFTNAIIPEYRSSKLIDRASQAMFTYALVIDGHCKFIFFVSNHISYELSEQMPLRKGRYHLRAHGA